MSLEQIKELIEQEKENEDVKTYLQGLNPLTVDGVNKFISENEDAKKWIDSEKDKHYNKAFETWKGNNLQKLIDDAVAKSNPSETPEQKQIRELTERLNKKEADEKRQTLLNKALLKADEKKLPKDVLEYFLGDDEESTQANLNKLEAVFSSHVETLVQERLKGSSYTPPKGGDGKVITLEDLPNMKDEEINKNWDVIQELLKGK